MLSSHDVVLTVESYIAHPYWAESEQVVNVFKKSGYNQVRSDAKREERLRNYLKKIEMPVADFEQLQARAAEQWYRDGQRRIFIPRHHFSGCLVQAIYSNPPVKPVRDAGQLRSLVQIGDFLSDRTECDRVFSRFVRPTKDGRPLSNQRSLRQNEVLDGFTATGTLAFDSNEIKLDDMHLLLTYAGKYVGVGASRKMGYGRFGVESFQPSVEAAAA